MTTADLIFSQIYQINTKLLTFFLIKKISTERAYLITFNYNTLEVLVLTITDMPIADALTKIMKCNTKWMQGTLINKIPNMRAFLFLVLIAVASAFSSPLTAKSKLPKLKLYLWECRWKTCFYCRLQIHFCTLWWCNTGWWILTVGENLSSYYHKQLRKCSN